MWSDDSLYENEYGKCAYLAGAVRTETGCLDKALYHAGVRFEALECDVFCVGQCDEAAIKSCVKERLEKYLAGESVKQQDYEQLGKEINKLEIMESNMTMQEAVYKLYGEQAGADKERIKEGIEDYCIQVNYHLGKPEKVYAVSKESIEMFGVLSQIYLYILFDIIFVKFEHHLLMFLRGSVE